MSNRSNNLAEQRICRLLDENSFMEIGSLVTARNTDFNLADEATPSDGVITGHGLIDGNLVFVYSQDSSVLNGTIGEMHAKKIAAVYDRAMKMGAPVIGLLDCAGVRLQESVDALNALGMIYEKQVMASGVIPQICAVFGNCGGGLTVVPGLCDFAYMEADKAKMHQTQSKEITLENVILLLQISRAQRPASLIWQVLKKKSLHRFVNWSACFRQITQRMVIWKTVKMI